MHVLNLKLLEKALLAGGGVALDKMRKARISGFGELESKLDKSVVTDLDKLIEALLRQIYQQVPGLSRFHGEEFGAKLLGAAPGRFGVIVDPVDGTRSLINGDSNSTSIQYVYDYETKRIVAAMIVKPASGELWLAIDGETRYYLYNEQEERFVFVRVCRTKPIQPGLAHPTVYIDCLHPFTRGGRDMFRQPNLNALFGGVVGAGFGIFNNGSNGNHHALVAASNGTVAGSYTVAVGGIQDLGGIALVENAGGSVAAFHLTKERTLKQCPDPHDIEAEYDFLVTAPTEALLATLVRILHQAIAAG